MFVEVTHKLARVRIGIAPVTPRILGVRTRAHGFWILLLMLTWAGQIRAQDHRSSGTIVNAETGEPISGAVVMGNEQVGVYGISNAQGVFVIEPVLAPEVFTVSCLGYQSQTVALTPNVDVRIELTPATYALEAVEVVQNRSAETLKSLSRVTLDQTVLRRHSTATLGEALAAIDGVSFISTGSNIQLPVIHGLYGNRILVLNNGFRHGFQNWGSDHAPEIDVAGAERIEVVKGAAGVKYGPDALGGAVVIHPNDLLLHRPFYLNATSTYQTNGRGYGTNVSFGEGGQRFSYHVGANYNRVGDRHAPRYMLTNTGAESYAAQAGMAYRHGPWTAQVNYSLVNQNLGILRAAIGSSGAALIRNMEADIPTFIREFSYDINEPNQRVTHQMASASLSRILPNGKISLRYARQWNARQEFDVRRNADLPVLDLNLRSEDVQLEWEHQWLPRTQGTVGLQYVSQLNTNNPGTLVTPFIPNYAGQRWSAFLIESLEGDRATWELGVRYDYELNRVSGRDSRQDIFRDRFAMSNLTAAIGKVRKLSPRATLRSNLGSGWRLPNMAELFSFGQHESQTTFGLLRYEPSDAGGIQASRVLSFAESEVAPENSVKYTTEFEWKKTGHRLSATAYANYIRNFIFSRPIGVLGTARGPMPTFIMDQTDALFLGVDFTYTRYYHEHGRATFGASYIYSRNVQRDETLINQPPIHAHLNVEHAFHNTGIFDKVVCGVRPSYTFRQFQAPRHIPVRALIEGDVTVSVDDPIFDFQAAPPGYFLLHAHAQVHKGRFALNVEAHNILNTTYRDYLNNMRYFADELGRNFLISLTYNF